MVLIGALLSLSCTSTPPDEVFGDVETRLLTATSIRIEFRITAEGAVTADLVGGLTIESNGETTLVADGDFAGEAVALRLATQGERYYAFGNAAQRTLALRPVDLDTALIVGFTRMGLLHNLARLAEAAPPDHAAGGVREWVAVGDFSPVRLPEPGVAFAIVVAGEPAGTAVLDIDTDDLPLQRRQTVRFPNGEMQVTESYSNVAVTP